MNTIGMEKEELLYKSARWAEDEEYLECVRDILDSKVFQSMDQFIQHGHTTCKEHCIQVSYIAYEMCRNRGWDSRSAARAGYSFMTGILMQKRPENIFMVLLIRG